MAGASAAAGWRESVALRGCGARVGGGNQPDIGTRGIVASQRCYVNLGPRGASRIYLRNLRLSIEGNQQESAPRTGTGAARTVSGGDGNPLQGLKGTSLRPLRLQRFFALSRFLEWADPLLLRHRNGFATIPSFFTGVLPQSPKPGFRGPGRGYQAAPQLPGTHRVPCSPPPASLPTLVLRSPGPEYL